MISTEKLFNFDNHKMRNVTKSPTHPQHARFVFFSGIYRQNALLHKLYLLLPLNNRLLLFRLRPKAKGEKERNGKSMQQRNEWKKCCDFFRTSWIIRRKRRFVLVVEYCSERWESNYKSRPICHQFNHISISSPAVSTEAQFNCSYQKH